MANMMNYDIFISKFKIQSRYYVHFRTNTLGKGMNSFIPHLSVNYYHNYTFTQIALALNSPGRLICH